MTASKAKRLGHEDDADSAGRLVANEQNLGEQAAWVAFTLHAEVFTRQAVFAHATKTLIKVADQLLVTKDEYDVAASIGIDTELAA